MGALPAARHHLAGKPCGRRATSVAVVRVGAENSVSQVMVSELAAFGADHD
jgi:hypothetical protein